MRRAKRLLAPQAPQISPFTPGTVTNGGSKRSGQAKNTRIDRYKPHRASRESSRISPAIWCGGCHVETATPRDQTELSLSAQDHAKRCNPWPGDAFR